MIDPVWILFIPPALGVFARGLLFLVEDLPDMIQSRTPEGRRQVAYSRLVRKHQENGMSYGDALNAASNHVSTLTHTEQFRRFACAAYAETGKPLSQLKEEWWKARGKAIEEVREVTQPKHEALRYAKLLRETIFTATEDEIFVHEPAASKWRKQKAERDAEVEAIISRHRQSDPVQDYVLDGLYAARRKL